MILNLLGRIFKKEKDEKIGNEHFKVEIEICTALPIAEENIVGDMPLAMGYYVFIASSLFSSHSITRLLLGIALSVAQLTTARQRHYNHPTEHLCMQRKC